MSKPDQTPEGQLIEARIERLGLSKREAARRSGLSEGRLRQVVAGYLSVGRGQYADVVAPPKTLAQVADALGIEPDELRAAGRADAAEVQEARRVPRSATPRELTDDAWPEGSASTVVGGVDGDGAQVIRVRAASQREDGSRARVEVKYWPGDGYTAKGIDLMGVAGEVLRSVRKHTARLGQMTPEEINEERLQAALVQEDETNARSAEAGKKSGRRSPAVVNEVIERAARQRDSAPSQQSRQDPPPGR